MKKFKKIAAVMVAAVTLAATAITVSASSSAIFCTFCGQLKEKTIKFNTLNSEYGLSSNIIHYTDMLKYKNDVRNNITFSSVKGRLMEGNVVLSVDFSNPDATSSKEKYKISDELREMIPYYVGTLNIRNAKGEYITEGKYPLIVDYNAPKAYINVMVGHPSIFRNFEKRRLFYYVCEEDSSKNIFKINYIIKNNFVLPSYNIVLEEITNAPNPIKLSGEHCNRIRFTEKDGEKETYGFYHFTVLPQYAGKSFYAYIDGIKVGKVTFPQTTDEDVSWVEY